MDVQLRELKSVNYYVPVLKDCISMSASWTIEVYNFMENVQRLDRDTDWLKGIDTIYGILPRTAESKWFTEAVSEGTFVNLLDYIKEKAEELDLVKLAEARRYREYLSDSNSYSYRDNRCFSPNRNFADALLPFLKHKNGIMTQLCQALVDSQSNLISVDNSLISFLINIDTSNVVSGTDYSGMAKASNKKYPLIDQLGRILFGNVTVFDKKVMSDIAQYVNLIDAEDKKKNKG